MLTLDDPKWKTLRGGYRTPYNAAVTLQRMQRGAHVWEELWNELHHQGDVDEASYAAVPHLVRIAKGWARRDWNLYGLLSTIEVERHAEDNPPLPDWCRQAYAQAWRELFDLALADLRTEQDPLTLRSLLGALALARGQMAVGALLALSDVSELRALAEEQLGRSLPDEDEEGLG
ncbi:hypothetical protein FGE12_06340 [Aggregicoccus sp. 17bor-14]|uniref:hypothetical protein n=1 Tax=Myxococcaceae TaxID=31 RepID=UPI00129C8F20|nr:MULTISPECIES: hypothetical protein [Myxococcaceae]MBF5042006.1 hypothetical protein [Simulacricoccus sp. 17bor-14]MRI87786.1 hypothetical protein [Aggregicoccus sp. 17bor-14]